MNTNSMNKENRELFNFFGGVVFCGSLLVGLYYAFLPLIIRVVPNGCANSSPTDPLCFDIQPFLYFDLLAVLILGSFFLLLRYVFVPRAKELHFGYLLTICVWGLQQLAGLAFSVSSIQW